MESEGESVAGAVIESSGEGHTVAQGDFGGSREGDLRQGVTEHIDIGHSGVAAVSIDSGKGEGVVALDVVDYSEERGCGDYNGIHQRRVPVVAETIGETVLELGSDGGGVAQITRPIVGYDSYHGHTVGLADTDVVEDCTIPIGIAFPPEGYPVDIGGQTVQSHISGTAGSRRLHLGEAHEVTVLHVTHRELTTHRRFKHIVEGELLARQRHIENRGFDKGDTVIAAVGSRQHHQRVVALHVCVDICGALIIAVDDMRFIVGAGLPVAVPAGGNISTRRVVVG